MKAFKVIRDPKAFQLLADETRRRMIYLLRAKERSVSQIADELGKTPQAIYHHIKKLRAADMVEVAREERVDHFIETYYRSSAEVFSCSYGEEGTKDYAEKEIREVLEALKKLGMNIRFEDETVTKLVDLKQRLGSGKADEELEAKADELEDISFMTRQGLSHFAQLLTMSDKEFEEHRRLEKEFRDLLRSMIVE
jgi:DNA-binding transcriptional ArsR family regulator